MYQKWDEHHACGQDRNEEEVAEEKAKDAPTRKSKRDMAQIAGNFASRPVIRRIFWLSSISRRKTNFFLRCVDSLISSRRLLGLLVICQEYPLGKIRGGDAQKHEKANYHANAAINCMVVTRVHLLIFDGIPPGACPAPVEAFRCR